MSPEIYPPGSTEPEPQRQFSQDHYDRLMQGQQPWLRFLEVWDWRYNKGHPWDAFQKHRPAEAARISAAVDAWNKQPPWPALLEGANLMEAQLAGVSLMGAQMAGANLPRAHLERANLHGADLAGATLHGAHLEGAILIEAHMEGADLTEAHLENAMLIKSHMEGANLREAHMEGVFLYRAHLEEAILIKTRLDGADLMAANLAGTNLTEASLEGADVRATSGLTVDDTRIRNTRFEPTASDEWSVLRQSYTGPRFAITLLALVAFVVPYLAKSLGFVTANRAQQRAAVVFEDVSLRLETALSERDSVIIEGIERLRTSEAPGMEQLATALEAQRFSVSEGLAQARNTVASAVPPIADCGESFECTVRSIVFPPTPVECQAEDGGWACWRVWQLAVSADEGLIFFVPALLLILYYIARAGLTIRVAAMRDAEERSGCSPYFLPASSPYYHDSSKYHARTRALGLSAPGSGPRMPWRVIGDTWIEIRHRRGSFLSTDAYGGLYLVHKFVLTPLLYVAAVSFVLHMSHWLMLVIAVPA